MVYRSFIIFTWVFIIPPTSVPRFVARRRQQTTNDIANLNAFSFPPKMSRQFQKSEQSIVKYLKQCNNRSAEFGKTYMQ